MTKYLIDIDGTMTNEVCFTPEECLGATVKSQTFIDKINKLGHTPGNDVTFYTARKAELMSATFAWLYSVGITCPFSVSIYKIPGSVYIDDDSIQAKDL